MDTEPLILAIETSSRRGSVGLGRPPGPPLSLTLQTDRTHTAELLPAIRTLLSSAGCTPGQVAIVAFSQGPGSFTGLRVACTLAQAWQAATGARVVAVSSLAALARNALHSAEPPARLWAVLDARQGRVFTGCYQLSGERTYEAVRAPALESMAQWASQLADGDALIGDGAALAEPLPSPRVRVLDQSLWFPDAREVLTLAAALAAEGRFCSREQIVPLYLRVPECEEVYEQRRAAAVRRRAGKRH